MTTLSMITSQLNEPYSLANNFNINSTQQLFDLNFQFFFQLLYSFLIGILLIETLYSRAVIHCTCPIKDRVKYFTR